MTPPVEVRMTLRQLFSYHNESNEHPEYYINKAMEAAHRRTRTFDASHKSEPINSKLDTKRDVAYLYGYESVIGPQMLNSFKEVLYWLSNVNGNTNASSINRFSEFNKIRQKFPDYMLLTEGLQPYLPLIDAALQLYPQLQKQYQDLMEGEIIIREKGKNVTVILKNQDGEREILKSKKVNSDEMVIQIETALSELDERWKNCVYVNNAADWLLQYKALRVYFDNIIKTLKPICDNDYDDCVEDPDFSAPKKRKPR